MWGESETLDGAVGLLIEINATTAAQPRRTATRSTG